VQACFLTTPAYWPAF